MLPISNRVKTFGKTGFQIFFNHCKMIVNILFDFEHLEGLKAVLVSALTRIFFFAERRLLLAAEPFAIMCAYLISTDLYRGRHVPVCREPVHVRGKSARLFYRPETI